ncbi:MAG: iron donor protein CyaY [Magnetospirillum sp. WYHS-4]
MTLDDSTFEAKADATLNRLQDAIEEALGDVLEADLQAGILIVDLDVGGQYVINKHRPNRQIWMSSPKSGASHFQFDTAIGAWVSTRGTARLEEMLATELSALTGRDFALP